MKVFYSDRFVLPLPEGHRFPMAKYRMLRERVEAAGICAGGDLREPRALTDEELLLVHTEGYIESLVSGSIPDKAARRIGFPWSPEMVERCRRTCGGTLGGALVAIEEARRSGWGVAANLAGGTHHAFAHRGEGFCVFNDSALAAKLLQRNGHAERVVVIDTDVHQGNGTAAILEGDSSVFTFSIHGAKNFPFNKERSDLDIPLDDGTGDDEYLESLAWGLDKSLAAIDADVAIFLAGADPFEGDRLGRMSVTREGLAGRDRLVLDALKERAIPTVITMAGGYARQVSETVDIHFETVRYAASLHEGSGQKSQASDRKEDSR
ncbi:histone deacetylase [Rubrobacter indicoceani]|uniref:histone deacetylase family protein n=1 Tax=Rubrobacter indicoceani TaxID=2051957 RepID=UPI000E5A6CE7|nr:histone deacetylase [Rubrobacter indicoceani]